MRSEGIRFEGFRFNGMRPISHHCAPESEVAISVASLHSQKRMTDIVSLSYSVVTMYNLDYSAVTMYELVSCCDVGNCVHQA